MKEILHKLKDKIVMDKLIGVILFIEFIQQEIKAIGLTTDMIQ